MANGRLPLIVTAPNGTDLRREPHTNPKTENGEDNVIRFLPKDTYLRLEKEGISATSRYRWALVSLEDESKIITGWTIVDDLGPPSIDATSSSYTFTFGNKSYKIYKYNLDAVKEQYIFEKYSRGMRRVMIDNLYYSTQRNISVMNSVGYIEEI